MRTLAWDFAFVLAADRADAKLRGGVSLRFHPAPVK